ncbi:unnamed protein product, partial [Mesorhabditis belari]|uniref:Uncharacterized protein n=1 Tax=Mesorhabditis belari TaxID=2138241 RepID=A0AAF3FGR8_9BILA
MRILLCLIAVLSIAYCMPKERAVGDYCGCPHACHLPQCPSVEEEVPKTIRHLMGYPSSYYNCSGKTYEEWMLTGEKWPFLGHLLMILGTLYIVLYLPTIYAMVKLRLMRNECYKIMFCLIMADIGNIFVNSFIAGYVFSVGGVFCSNPVFSYISGAYSYIIWSIASYLYIFLAVNRLIIVINNPSVKQSFEALVQAILITLPAMIASWLYVYIQIFNVATLEMAITAHFAWQTTTGISALIYLTLNHSIKDFYRGKRIIHQSSYVNDSEKDTKTTKQSATN